MTVLLERRYFAQDFARDHESERLLNLQAALDPLTTSRLESIGIGPGWNCLEVGAGQGSIARWMAQTVAPRGRVVATDIDLRLLDHLDHRFIEVREHDIVTDDLEENAYDVAHCRLVLLHVNDPLTAVERIVASLRPGGWLVLEEPVFVEPHIITPEHPVAGSFARVYRVFMRHMAQLMDLTFGSMLVRIVAEMGLEGFHAEQARIYAPGGHPGAIAHMLTWEMFRDEMLATGEVDLDDLDVASAAMLDPSFIVTSPHIFGVFARKPL